MSAAKAIIPECLVLLLNICLYSASATSQIDCQISGEAFADNSTYQANLNALISSLSSGIGDSGFYNASVGEIPDRVNAIVLCRGDISLPACRECVGAAAPALPQQCRNNKDAIFWNGACMVRYSSQTIFGRLDILPVWRTPSSSTVLNPQQHDRELRALLESLKGPAANDGSFKKVAAGNRSTIFALEQCTPDLSVQDCSDCLTAAIDDIPTCCSGIIGAEIARPSCILRFENYHFYNASMVEVPQGPLPQEKDSKRIAIIVAVSGSVFLILIISIGILLRRRMNSIGILLRRRMKQKPKGNRQSIDEASTVEGLQYDFGKIRAATNDFSDDNKLGQGGFGAVYKGLFPNGQEIAVKRLSIGSGQGHLEFQNEVLLLARLQHRNLVRLLGFSLEGNEKLLVYEFIENASLDHFLFDPMKRSHLDWNRRHKIIAGVARGFLYLHEDSRIKIIHRDMKTSNVLLDGEMNPKIADFGMARLVGQDETRRNTNRIVGTYGYMPPEYVMHGHFSVKSDVFSFGVTVLEIMTGQKNNRIENGEIVDLLTLTWENWRQGTVANLIDPVLMTGMGSLQDMLRCIHIGLLCVQENAANRPTMTSIVLMLSSSKVTLPIPSEPGFFTASRFGPEISFSLGNDSRESNSSKASNGKSGTSDGSRNAMSLTEFYPR